MDKVTLHLKADEQILTSAECPFKLASNTVSYVEAVFDLGENWTGYDSVRAVWTTYLDTIATVLDSEGKCVVPHEVLTRTGKVSVNLVGSIVEDEELTDRLTTYPTVALNVNADAYVEGTETAPITPSQFEQYIAIVEQVVGSIKDIDHTELTDDYCLIIYYTDGTNTGKLGPIRGATGATGATGNGISSAVLNNDYTLTINYTNGQHDTLGPIRGAQGETGNGIDRIAKTATSGYVDTYTIYYTNGSTTTFTVTNGEVSTADLQNAITPLQYVDCKSQVQIKSPFTDKISLIGVNVQTAGKQGTVAYLNLAYKAGNEAVVFGGNEVIKIPQEICPPGNTILFATLQSGTTLTSCYIRSYSSSIVIYGTLNANAELRLMGFYSLAPL